MARKKIIFVMVEGPSDGDSLGVLLNRLYKDEAVYIHVMHCDITTKNGVFGCFFCAFHSAGI